MSRGLCRHSRTFYWARAAQYAPVNDVVESDRSEKDFDLSAELLPEIVRKATPGSAKTAFRTVDTAACCFDGLVDGKNDVRDAHFLRWLRQAVAAPWPACGDDQATASQLDEQLFQIGQRNFLAPRDLGQRNMCVIGSVAALAGQIGHSHDRIASLCAQFHRVLLGCRQASAKPPETLAT